MPGVNESGRMVKVEDGAGGGGAGAVDLSVVVNPFFEWSIRGETARFGSRIGVAGILSPTISSTSLMTGVGGAVVTSAACEVAQWGSISAE